VTQRDTLTREQGVRLHQELLAGNLTATARIAEAFCQAVEARLLLRFPSLSDPHLVPTAVTDAFLNYFRKPTQFDANQLSLPAYLYMSARGDLLNALEAGRVRGREISLTQDVELDDAEAENTVEVAANNDLEEEVLAKLTPVFERIDALFTNERDRELVRLLIDGERDTGEFAVVLGIQDQPIEEQARTVKRHKDRLKKMLQRHQTELLEDE
jgi:RNA polymerase sigma-70 factor, ECF subfamily